MINTQLSLYSNQTIDYITTKKKYYSWNLIWYMITKTTNYVDTNKTNKIIYKTVEPKNIKVNKIEIYKFDTNINNK